MQLHNVANSTTQIGRTAAPQWTPSGNRDTGALSERVDRLGIGLIPLLPEHHPQPLAMLGLAELRIRRMEVEFHLLLHVGELENTSRSIDACNVQLTERNEIISRSQALSTKIFQTALTADPKHFPTFQRQLAELELVVVQAGQQILQLLRELNQLHNRRATLETTIAPLRAQRDALDARISELEAQG